mmetsp:Transcript_32148/g.31467  ORF Transcript_32148/g.31467 Transcript_32148/m.31467 type:complete len:80 (+) Transcript_32148:947-1186(+)
MQNVNTITRGIIQRKRFSYKRSHIFQYLKMCLCFRKVRKLKNRADFKKHFYFEKGEEKLIKELDVVNLLKSIRNLKLLT